MKAVKKYKLPGTSLLVQWLKLCASTAGGMVRFLAGN